MDTVQVALRVRPLLAHELERGCRQCLETIPGVPQVKIFKNAFTFNHVFDHHVPQSDVYNGAVKNLVQQLFKGYNVTVLAYGQTGSGKTHSMGTNYPSSIDKGIIPRAVDDIFQKVTAEEEWEFKIKTSFLELYNEQLYDLLAGKPKDQCLVDIREDSRGICIPGLTEVDVSTADDTLQCLQQGSNGRATGATAMNSQSSRSHAIFTIYIYQTKRGSETEAMSAKFHLVDLAGSERSKRTKATGDRFKEGVNINRELFVLGNVISALGEGNHSFINYRDSKLTRLLQDSLGGNALTIMIACVSPADDNHSETLSTLRYADRARKIKNRPIVNQDPRALEIMTLKRENEELRLELLARGGSDIVSSCPPEHAVIAQKMKTLSDALSDAFAQNAAMCERALMAEEARDSMKLKLAHLNSKYGLVVNSVRTTLNESQLNDLKELQSQIIDLQAVQQKNDEAIMNHERSVSSRTPKGSPVIHDKDTVTETPGEDVVHRENYLMQASELSKQLQELTQDLAWKEQVVLNMVSSSSQMTGLQTLSEKNLQELEQQIACLQKEKDELNGQLKNVHSNATSNKLAEQRRKRLLELEQKIALLSKKVTEQARVIKMKENSDQKINVLNSEIVNMKKTKVRLINQMKLEGEKYRSWKAQRERELCKLKQQERQRLNQITRMEHLHLKQQNVLRRKVEEAAAINKRLKDAMALQKNAQEKRNFQGNPERISQWINQELEIMLSTVEAERTLDQLVEDRATLNGKLQVLKAKIKNTKLNEEERNVFELEIKKLNQNLDLRSTQIMDLKQKIEDSDQENKAKTRWDTVQSMVDAKCALKCLFEAVADTKKECTSKEVVLQEIHEIHNDVLNTLKKKEQEAIKQHKAMRNLEQEYEEKIYLLLRQLEEKDKGHSSSSSDEEMIRIKEDELSKMDELRSNMEYWMQKCEDLEKRICEQKVLTSIENKLEPSKKVVFKQDPATPENLQGRNAEKVKCFTPGYFPSDDDDDDPDWKKTPLYRRLQSLKERTKGTRENSTKRGNDGEPKCTCRTNCSTKICSCRKFGTKCSKDCKCDGVVCMNRDTESNQEDIDPNVSGESEHSFKKIKCDHASTFESTDALSTTYTTANSSAPSGHCSLLNTTFSKLSD